MSEDVQENKQVAMTMTIYNLVERYGRFEQRVRQWTEKLCRPYCSVCRHICCRAHFCIETRQSAFLTTVVTQCSRHSVFNATHGWLDQQGCTLVAGRPPVCYEFICRAIVDAVAGDPFRHHALLVASMVIPHVGKKAIGGRHVVEATNPAELNRINPVRFLSRLELAEATFDMAAAFLEGRQVNAHTDLFSHIVPPPRKDTKVLRRLM